MRAIAMIFGAAVAMTVLASCTADGRADLEQLRALHAQVSNRIDQVEGVIEHTSDQIDAVTIELDAAIRAARDAGDEAEALRIERARAETTDRLSSVLNRATSYLEAVRPYEQRIAAELEMAGDSMSWDEGLGAAFRVAEPALPPDWKVYGSLAVGLLGVIGTLFENRRARTATSAAADNQFRANTAWDEVAESQSAFENLVAAIDAAKNEDGTVSMERVSAASMPATKARVREVRKG